MLGREIEEYQLQLWAHENTTVSIGKTHKNKTDLKQTGTPALH
jgi:hypothetical protein